MLESLITPTAVVITTIFFALLTVIVFGNKAQYEIFIIALLGVVVILLDEIRELMMRGC